ncbi:MAG: type II secretion system protein GspM [Maricaulaceae bacterium]
MGLSNRSPRERYLILIAIALAGVFMLWQFLLRPAFTMRADVNTRYNSAVRDHDIVSRAVPYLGTTGRANREAFNRAVLINMAAAQNVTIARLQPGNEQSLQAWFEQNSAPEILAFLNAVEVRYDVEIERVQMQRRANNLISAQVTFAPIANSNTK